jgi:hypothetical protein
LNLHRMVSLELEADPTASGLAGDVDLSVSPLLGHESYIEIEM